MNKNGGAQFPEPKEKVFKAVIEAVGNLKGFKVKDNDEYMGRVVVKAGISAFSWGETVPVQISSISDNETSVSLTSGETMGWATSGYDFGKNQRNIEKILKETSRILQQK